MIHPLSRTFPLRSSAFSLAVRRHRRYCGLDTDLFSFFEAPPADGNSSLPDSPAGVIPNSFAFPLSQMQATQLNGGSVKIVDSRSFTAATAISAAEVTVEPGAIR